MPFASRLSEKTRSSCGAIATKICASLVVLNGPPAIVVSTVRMPRMSLSSASIDRIASSIAETLAPSGATMLISNWASSTPDGRKSWRTTPYRGITERMTATAMTATSPRLRSAPASTYE